MVNSQDILVRDYTTNSKKQATVCRRNYIEKAAFFSITDLPFLLLYDKLPCKKEVEISLDALAKKHKGILTIILIFFEPKSNVADEFWELMHIGITDVYQWVDEDDFAEYIQNGLRRKTEVEKILNSSLVSENLIGTTTVWKNFLRNIIEVALYSTGSVLLTGESGTGKELVSRLIHTIDPRKAKKDLVLVDCTTIVPELSGSEFFGHERGSYTNALQTREGAFALANKGTLFLDEIGDLPLHLQAELLRVIQEGTFKKVGSNTWQKTDFRLVCATHRNIRHQIEENKFRHDLFYRIADFEFKVPSLEERVDDIPTLANYFLSIYYQDTQIPEFDDVVMDFIKHRTYNGNVRELKQFVNRIAMRHVKHKKITPGEIPPEDRLHKPTAKSDDENIYMEVSVKKRILSGASLWDLKNSTMDIAIRTALELNNGDKKIAAEKLGINLRTIQQFLSGKK